MTSPSRSARYGGAMMSGPNLTSGLTSSAGRRARAIDLDDLDGPDAGDLASLADLGDAPQPSPVDMVVFDIGNVLVRWEPRAALLDAVGEDAATALLTDPELDFFAHNLAADGGRGARSSPRSTSDTRTTRPRRRPTSTTSTSPSPSRSRAASPSCANSLRRVCHCSR